MVNKILSTGLVYLLIAGVWTSLYASSNSSGNLRGEVADTDTVTVLLLDSNSNQLTSGSLRYYDNGAWQTVPANGDGSFSVITSSSSVSLEMTYENRSVTKSSIPVPIDTVTFQTVDVTFELKNSVGELIDEGGVEFYADGWHTVGTTSGGTVTKELLPGNYAFKMTYEDITENKPQDIEADNIVTFQTARAEVHLINSAGQLFDEGIVQYYAGSWKSMGPTSGGIATIELFPKEYAFKMTYESITHNKTQDISTDSIITFQTAKAEVQLRNEEGALVGGGTAEVYSGGWKTVDSTGVGLFAKELLPKKYAFKMIYEGQANTIKQDIGIDPTIVFQTVPTATDPVLTINQPVDGTITQQDSITVSGTVDNPSSTTVTVNSQIVTIESDGSFTIAVALAEGSNVITISAENHAGSITDEERNVVKDTTAPVVSIISPPDSSFANQSQIAVDGTVSEPVSALIINSDTVSVNPDDSFSAVVTLLEGFNDITVHAIDLAGNSTTESLTVTGDFTAPVLLFAVALGDPSEFDTDFITLNDNDSLYIELEEVYLLGGIDSELTNVIVAINGDSVPTEQSGEFESFEKMVILEEGVNSFEVLVTDQAGNSTSLQFFLITPRSYKPSITINYPHADFETDSASVHVVGTVIDSSESAILAINDIPVPIAQDGSFNQKISLFPGVNYISVRAVNATANDTTESLKVVKNYISAIPPQPEEIAPPNDSTVATTVFNSTEFIYKGDSLIQLGVEEGTIEPVRASVVRGKIFDSSGSPLSGVLVTILDHPEFGYTHTRDDGMFDMVVNGGGVFTMNYKKNNYLPVQRQINTPWQDFAIVDSVYMIQLDTNVTNIDFSDSLEVAQGGAVTDDDGTRKATLMFEQGTVAKMVLPDGSTQSLSSLNVRATEFTVGENGPAAMPGELPPTSGYTYAAEFSVDEAIAAGATSVTFDKPVAVYVENFIGFPVGSAVPAGYYDRQKGEWIASENGRVIEITSITNGMAEIDISGDGSADISDSLLVIGIDDAERKKLATLYSIGTDLWRIEVEHFTPWDFNWPYEPPADAIQPSQNTENLNEQIENQDEECGCFIGVQNQTLGESIDITGAPFDLFYHSGRMPGYLNNFTLNIPISDSTLPQSLNRIFLSIRVAGRLFFYEFPASPNLEYTFVWDGKDSYGRKVNGKVPVMVKLGYAYNGVYQQPAQSSNSFGEPSGIPYSITGRQEITYWQQWQNSLGNLNLSSEIGSWTPDIHHKYDPIQRTIYFGNGSFRRSDPVDRVVDTIVGTGESGFSGDGGPAVNASISYIGGMAVDDEGNIYISDSNNNRIRKIDSDGIISTIAGTGNSGNPEIDGIPALQADIRYPGDIALGNDGSIYFVQEFDHVVRRISPSGTINTVVGVFSDGDFYGGFSGDGGPAINAQLSRPVSIDVGPSGSLYILDGRNARVRKVSSNGIITTVAGDGEFNSTGDNGLATEASLFPYIEFFSGTIYSGGIEVGPNGDLYISEVSHQIRKVTQDGIITTIAGTRQGLDSSDGYNDISGDGGPAEIAFLSYPKDLELDSNGTLYVVDRFNHRVRSINSEGTINTVAGSGNDAEYFFNVGYSGEGGSATAARIDPIDIAIGPDGDILIADLSSRVTKVSQQLPGFDGGEFTITSEDGSELYLFSQAGSHLKTTDALTGVTLFDFKYDSAGLLSRIIDIDSLITSIDRNLEGNPISITSPFSQVTSLSVDSVGYLSTILNSAGEETMFGYSSLGLLSSKTNARGFSNIFTYDSDGLLLRDDEPNGGFTQLTRNDFENGHEVITTTAEGRTRIYRVESIPTGGTQITTIDENNLNTLKIDGQGGITTNISPDGSILTTRIKPDPRFGMQAPLTDTLRVTTPSGLTSVFTQARTITQVTGEEVTGITDSLITNGKITVSEYDGNQRMGTTTSPEGRQAFTKTDSLGRVIQSSVPGIAPVNYTYDANGFLTETEQGGRTTSYFYNSQGWLESVTDPLGRVETTAYDSVGRVTTQTLPNGEQILYDYDENGNLASITPPGKPAHTFSYTEVDLTDGYTPPAVPDSAGGISYLYDKDKKLLQTVFSDSTSIQMVYDTTFSGSSRPMKINYDQGSTALSYDSTTGNLTTLLSSDSVVTSYSYDGSLTTQIATSGPISGTIDFTYNNDFQVTEQSINGANTVGFTYDDDGLLVGAGEMSMNYDLQSGLLGSTSVGNVSGSYSYNALGELTSTSFNYNSSALFDRSYGLDSLGRITSVTETIDGATDTYRYAYNDIGYLVEEKVNGVVTAEYLYDANGNRMAYISEGDTTTAAYDDQDRMLTYGDTNFIYGKRGDLQRKVVGTDTTIYDYDNQGNLRSVVLPNDTTIEYIIDGQGRRVAKKVNGQTTKRWLYSDGLLPVAELDSSGNIQKRYAPGYIVKNDTTYRVIKNHLGSVRMVVNSETGEVVQRLDYDAWGNINYLQNQDEFTDIGFSGGLYDKDTGLVRFGVRDYDPQTGRWTSKDPILFASGTSNLYEYVLNDPVNKIDLNGLQAIQASLGIGASAGFFGVGHIGLNVGISFDVADPWNSKIFANAQASGTVGIGVSAYGSIQPAGYVTSTQLESGLSSQTITHTEIAIGAGSVYSVSTNIPFETGESCYPFGIQGIGSNAGVGIGVGVAGYGGTGIGKVGTYVSPSGRDIYALIGSWF